MCWTFDPRPHEEIDPNNPPEYVLVTWTVNDIESSGVAIWRPSSFLLVTMSPQPPILMNKNFLRTIEPISKEIYQLYLFEFNNR